MQTKRTQQEREEDIFKVAATHRFVVEIETEDDPVYAVDQDSVRNALENGGFVGHMGIQVKAVKEIADEVGDGA